MNAGAIPHQPLASRFVALPRGRRATAAWTAAATFLIAFATGALVHRGSLWWPQAAVDERAYLHAFDLVEAGRSPYEEPKFLYTPAFAVAGAAVRAALGENLGAVYRTVNLAGACALAMVAFAGSAWRWPARTAAAAAAAASPLVGDGLQCGNVSLLLLGCATVAIALAERHPWAGGGMLGVVTATKPVGVSALLLLAVPPRGRGWRRARVGVLVAAGAAGGAWLLLGGEHLPAMLSRAGGLPDVLTNVSVARALHALRVPVHPAAVFAAVTAAGLALAWRWRPEGRAQVALAASTSLLALPVNNPSTFVYGFPAQALALERAVAALRGAPVGQPRRRAVAILALVAAAVCSANGALGVAAAGGLPPVGQGLVTAIPLLAVAGLTLYGARPAARSVEAARPDAAEPR